jgi:MSHA pilin protein MshD
MTAFARCQNQRGVTLVELIVAMIVISVALGGVLLVINYTTLHSADPVLRQQAIAIAEAYLEEITLKEFADPGGPVELGRADFDNVADYNGLSDVGARDQTDTAIAGLGNYTVAVVVVPANFGPTAPPPGAQVAGLQINVTVTDPAGENLTLTGFRANY